MILMNDFKAEPTALREAMLRSVAQVIDSGWYVLGRAVESFEAEWATACGVAHGVGVGNGMDAIELALRALDIGAGDEVITTPMTAFATVLAIIRAGATPVLADIDPETALLSMTSTRRCLSEKTKAVVLVHLYGQMRDMDNWRAFCTEHNIALVEDCAQAHLASWGGLRAGAHGAAGAYSFYPTKNLGALGDGGMLVTNCDALKQRVASLRNYGQSERYHHPLLGMNSRLDEIQAALLSERLKWLDEFTQRRRAIATTYWNEIHNPCVNNLAVPQEAAAHVHHLYCVTSSRREQLQVFLREREIQTLIHYPVPVHLQEPCLALRRDPAGLASSEIHANTCLSLPCHPQMTDADVWRVVAAVNAWAE
ncbi:DegT/DnrJ/EryC1/StrS family aminotransferase [Candidatus Kaiserbacteria bacterium]|nr:DegT/DnrJ/EryC1/StrS family aminotransferase [Candidatus Kaiserbacteria bacterium]